MIFMNVILSGVNAEHSEALTESKDLAFRSARTLMVFG